MITDNLKQELLSRHSTTLNFNALVEFMEESKVEFIGCELRNVLGMATGDKVRINMGVIGSQYADYLFFVILHEYCHTIRINRMGKKQLVESLSTENLDDLVDHVVGEEILADRYGSRMFFRFNNRIFPSDRTQRLHIKINKESYKNIVSGIHGKIQGSEEKYDKLINSFIITE